jgi:hypothetical protein
MSLSAVVMLLLSCVIVFLWAKILRRLLSPSPRQEPKGNWFTKTALAASIIIITGCFLLVILSSS